MRLEHVNLTVSDLDRSVAFYSDLLDLTVRWQGAFENGRRAAHVGDDGAYLALFETIDQGAVRENYTTPGYNHMGFVVDDLDDAAERLKKLGADFGEIQDYEPGRRLYCYDPAGHEVELVEY